MKSPFKFLDSYTKDDRDIFFGRDREIEELYQRVFDSKLLLVYGISGTGKSSLIHCGLANKFNETDWLPIVIRRRGNIIESLSAGIRSASLTNQQSKFATPGDFKKAVRSLYLDHYKPVFFIFDQFEELFIFGNKEERKSFINIVKSLYESDLQCRMIFIMREEYMAGVTEFEKYISTFFANRVRIEKISHINALEAIKGPCKAFNISLEEGFAEALLEKLSPGETDVELTYLQVFLDKIFRLAIGFTPPLGGAGGSVQTAGGSSQKEGSPPSFTLSLLDKSGKVSDLLGSFLEEQLKALDEPDTGLSILKSFVSLKGTKKQLTQQEVIESSRAFGKDIPAEKVSDLLQKFVNLRILRDKDENDRFELRHDSLATKIYEKITLVEKEMMEVNQFLENALLSYQKRKVLLNLNDFKYIAPYEDRLFVGKEIKDLINNSKKILGERQRNIKKISIVGIVAILFFSLGTFLLTQQSFGFSFLSRWIGIIVYTLFFLPLFITFVTRIRENRTMNLLFMFLTLLLVGNIYLYSKYYSNRIRNLRFNRALQNEQRENGQAEIFNSKTDSLYRIVEKISAIYKYELKDLMKNTDTLKQVTDDLITYIQDLKIEIVIGVESGSDAVDGRKIIISKIKYFDDFNVPAQVLIGHNNNGKAYILSSLIKEYNKLLLGLVRNDNLIGPIIDRTLDLKNTKIFETRIKVLPDGSWEQNTFLGKTTLVIIETLSQLQADIKYCESEVMTYLYNKMVAEIGQK